MSEEMLVRHGAPTLAGLKTANLFTCQYDSLPALYDEIRRFNRRLGGKGLRLLPLRSAEGRALLYLYRPDRLQEDLADAETRQLLQEAGYGDLRPGRCLPRLMQRLQPGGEFPHEIGLFLGYPAEDVRGFIRHKGRHCKCVGCWKVYGDPRQAQQRFECFRLCTDAYCRRYAMGVPVEQLAMG
ncbi:MAG: DUF3793 family protein [Oscillospiraceae bacterium]|nr:DUF3793 family protein [Oscillospiraceae bacterium]